MNNSKNNSISFFKKFFVFSFLIVCLSFQSLHANTCMNSINAIIDKIKNDRSDAKPYILSVTSNLFDYDHFFKTHIPNIWRSANSNEKNQIIEHYNKKFINKYFSEIISCKNIQASLKNEGNSIACSFTCQNSKDKRPKIIKFATRNNKISDIRFKGMSFMLNEGGSLRNECKNSSKEDFLRKMRR